MASGLINKLTNFLMPVEEETTTSSPDIIGINERRTQLRVHSPGALKVYIVKPKSFDDVKVCADCLKTNVAVLINYEEVDPDTQQRLIDFLHGVSYVMTATSQRVSETVMLYVPSTVEVNKELYAYSLPAYIKNRKEL